MILQALHAHRSNILFRAGLDAAYTFVGYVAAVYVTLPEQAGLVGGMLHHAGFYFIFLLVWSWVAIDRGLWEPGRNEDLGSYLLSMIRAAVGAIAFGVFIAVPIANQELKRDFLAAFSIGGLVSLVTFRMLAHGAAMVVHSRGHDLRSVLIVGANPRSARLAEFLLSNPHHGYRVDGFIEDDASRFHFMQSLSVLHCGDFDDLEDVIDRHGIQEVHIALPVRSYYELVYRMGRICEKRGVPVHFLADLFPLRIARSRLLYIEDVPLLSLSAIPEARGELFLKRVLDLFVSTVMLMGLAPFFVIMAIIIKADSPGPVFFLQERVGLNGRRFKMIKFRSMVQDAEARRKALEALNEADGPVFKIRRDPRITRVGAFIRKYSLDEFPQLINVWLGQMTLVGPRPPIPAEVEKYTWDQRRRLSVKPGMTGLWQVSGRSDVGFEQWVGLDLAYIDHWSLWLDFKILLKTFHAVVAGRGAA
ncbi:MAG TPA: sugar transferase [Candidatus Hydrogenedentes bacterium]|nr:sugar transferase [Candidatus Hydrogenedentota bacterium]HOV73078.1 sugar transferase [Candidatus Hydrogenedentota bacterium]HPC16178.1 sugar transferase [Candidatus Hydrogenedentota bacterium]HRT18610.1 sugar transferase [Candidatus Hydrogenedentota bacterium]HRT63630.1 sugar transferase [Candidatus Hydrogenedentota bacterium]